MNLRVFPALFIFVGSYLPLSLIFLIQDINDESWKSDFCLLGLNACTFPKLKNPIAAFGFTSMCILSCIFLIFYFLRKMHASDEVYVKASKPIPNDLINYVFPYVVSFMGLDLSDGRKIAGFLIFFVWMFLITYRSGQILMNPVILLSRWKLYEATVTHDGADRHIRMLSTSNIDDKTFHKSCIVHGVYILSIAPGTENE